MKLFFFVCQCQFWICFNVGLSALSMCRQLVVECRAVLIEESVDPSTKTVSGGRKLSCAYAECCWNILGARHVFFACFCMEGGEALKVLAKHYGWLWINTYKYQLNSIFMGMNIHKSQLFYGYGGYRFCRSDSLCQVPKVSKSHRARLCHLPRQ